MNNNMDRIPDPIIVDNPNQLPDFSVRYPMVSYSLSAACNEFWMKRRRKISAVYQYVPKSGKFGVWAIVGGEMQ